MQLTVTLSEIQHLATNGKVYAQGKALAEGGGVPALFYDRPRHMLIARVAEPAGGGEQRVQLLLSPRERPKRISCTCAAARRFRGCCPHMVALLIAAMNVRIEGLELWDGPVADMPLRPGGAREERAAPPPSEERAPDRREARGQAYLARLRGLQRRLRRRAATPEDAERADCATDSPAAGDAAPLRFRLRLQLPRLSSEIALLSAELLREHKGTRRAFPLRDLEGFVRAGLLGRPLPLSRAFTYDPLAQDFDPCGERFRDWLESCYHLALERDSSEHLARNKVFLAAHAQLNPQRLRDFLARFASPAEAAALGLTFCWGTGELPLEPGITEGFPPLHFFWTDLPPRHAAGRALELRDASGQVLRCYSPENVKAKEEAQGLRLLTRDAGLLLCRRRLYRLDGETEAAATQRLLLQLLALSETPRLELYRSDADEFLTRLYPALSGCGCLRLSDPLAARLVDAPLRALIWLDREGRGLRLRLGFAYGDYMQNPHPSAGGRWYGRKAAAPGAPPGAAPEYAPAEAAPLVIRDRAGEEALLAELARWGFLAEPPRRRARPGRADGEPDPEADALYRLRGDEALLRFMSAGLDGLLKRPNTEVYRSERLRGFDPRPLPALRLALSGERDGGLLQLHLEDCPYGADELRRILQAYREKRGYVRLKSGGFVHWSSPGAAGQGGASPGAGGASDAGIAALELLDRLSDWGGELREGGMSLPAFRAVPLARLLAEGRLEGDAAARRYCGGLTEALREPAQLRFAPARELAGVLRGYQREGFAWLCALDYYGFGGILADDMGLGKTLQALAYVEYLRRERKKPVLVAAPTSLVYNWAAEAERFCPRLRVVLLAGAKKLRLERLGALAEADLVVCSYAVLRQDLKALRAHSFSAFLIDEAQFIKNPATQTSRAVKRIRAERRFALTGTPIENRLLELWSIFDFLMPGYLFSQGRFRQRFEAGGLEGAKKEALAELRLLTEPFILRRRKQEVLRELPDKISTTLRCDMNGAQEKLYYAYLAAARDELRRLSDKGEGAARMDVLSALTRLRQICCHPALFLRDYAGGSAKLEAFFELLERLRENGHRCLVFSQFTGLLQLIGQALAERQIPYLYLDGRVPARERPLLCARFNGGEGDLFLISLKAGGTGLNLTGADAVIHLDPWWNPAVEDQATDRAHRIGQNKVVQLFRLVTRGSVEEKICLLHDGKRLLMQTLVSGEENPFQRLSLEDLRHLLE